MSKRPEVQRPRNIPHPNEAPTSRSRPEASLHGSRSRPDETRPPHERGTNVGQRLPRRRVPGTNGSWPSAGAAPKRPAFFNLYGDLDEEDLAKPAPVFGMYPRALIPKILPWLRCERREVLHVCSGALPRGEGIRVDIRRDAHPDILADGRHLPLADGSVAAVMLDPPYTVQYARDLYGVDYPLPSHLLAEASRVVRPNGRIAFVHTLVPMPPPGCHVVKVFGLSTGHGFHMRAVTIFEREQARLDLGSGLPTTRDLIGSNSGAEVERNEGVSNAK